MKKKHEKGGVGWTRELSLYMVLMDIHVVPFMECKPSSTSGKGLGAIYLVTILI